MRSVNISSREFVIKLSVVVFLVAFCIPTLALTGFWLDYYKFDTLPMFITIGAISSTILALVLTWRVIIYGHNKEG